MRNIAQQLGGCTAIRPQLIGHGIKIPRQDREFVLAALETRAYPHVQVFRCECARAA